MRLIETCRKSFLEQENVECYYYSRTLSKNPKKSTETWNNMTHKIVKRRFRETEEVPPMTLLLIIVMKPRQLKTPGYNETLLLIKRSIARSIPPHSSDK